MKHMKTYLMKLLSIPQVNSLEDDAVNLPQTLKFLEARDYTALQEEILLRQDAEMWVQLFLAALIPDLEMDEAGNLYKINPNTPLICAHMDNVGNASQAELNKIQVYEWDRVQGKGVIWCDDKCWIAVALRLRDIYEKTNWISLLFTTGEETWTTGSRYFVKNNEKLLDQCTYAVIPDRMWASDFIGASNNYCTKEFEDKAMKYLSAFGFTPNRWVYSDCDMLNGVLNTFNISVGYMWHHTKDEHCFLSQLANTITALTDLIDNFNEKLTKPEQEVYNSYNGHGRYSSFDGFVWKKAIPYIEQYYDDDIFISWNIKLWHQDSGKSYYLPKGDYIIMSWEEDLDDYIEGTIL